jgi:hypothetical protein
MVSEWYGSQAVYLAPWVTIKLSLLGKWMVPKHTQTIVWATIRFRGLFLPKYVQVTTDKLVTYNVLWKRGSRQEIKQPEWLHYINCRGPSVTTSKLYCKFSDSTVRKPQFALWYIWQKQQTINTFNLMYVQMVFFYITTAYATINLFQHFGQTCHLHLQTFLHNNRTNLRSCMVQ